MTNRDVKVTFKEENIHNPQYCIIEGFHLPMLAFNLVHKSFCRKSTIPGYQGPLYATAKGCDHEIVQSLKTHAKAIL
jgi:hypothetical protein